MEDTSIKIAMKPKKDLSFNTRCIKIFLEDIEDIIKIMSNGERIGEISNDNIEYDSLDELKQKNKLKLKELNLINNNPYISIRIKHGVMGGVSLFAGDDAEFQFLKLKELLLKRNRWFSFMSYYAIFLLGCIALGLLSGHISNIGKSNPHFYQFLLLFIVISILTIISLACYTGYFTSIELNYSYEKQSFWARNSDQIITASIGTVIGGIAMWVILKLLENPPA